MQPGLRTRRAERGFPASIRSVGRNSKKPRRLLAGDDTYLWSVRHDHRVEYSRSGRFQGCPEYKDCRDLVAIRRFGARGRLVVSFPGGPGRLVFDCYGAGGVVGSRESGWLNLHEPGTVRALLDEALSGGWQPDDPAVMEIDGWPLSGAVAIRRSAQ